MGALAPKRTATLAVGKNVPDLSDIDLNVSSDLLNDKQKNAWDLLKKQQRHTLLYGGARGGKTVLFVKAIITRALRAAGSRHAILRFKANSVWASIGMDTFPKVMETFFPGIKYTPHSRDYFEFENGAQIWLGGLDDKDRVDKILGREYVTMYFNECSQIPYSSIVVALTRLAQQVPGLTQRAYYDLNPVGEGHWSNLLFHAHKDPVLMKPLTTPEIYASLQINPEDNKRNLSPEFLASLDLLPPKQRERFLKGTYQKDTEGQLWNTVGIEQLRVTRDQMPDLIRIVVAVDPSGAENALDSAHDDIGIIVAGLGRDGHGYVLEDGTLLSGPSGWGRQAINLFHKWSADCIIAEKNYGGAMVENTIRGIERSVPYKEMTASRGKVVRAEPVSALASNADVDDNGLPGKSGWRIHHVGRFNELENELCAFTDLGYKGERSPNRADAYVWAFTELMLGENAQGWIEHYARQAAKAHGKPLPEAKGARSAPASPKQTLMASPHAMFAMPGGGKRYTADEKGMLFDVAPEDVVHLIKAGCVRPEDEGI